MIKLAPPVRVKGIPAVDRPQSPIIRAAGNRKVRKIRKR